jgi:hypothetical protein
MKTHLLVLESHDDLISVKDKMSWAKTPRILLIWPKGERIALRPLDLKMLQRQARSLGAALGLVARDPRIRRAAAALGLPVFASPRAAQADLWPVPKLPKRQRTAKLRKSPADLRALRDESRPAQARWQAHPLVRVGFFALGVLAVLTLAALFLPHAEITLSPESKIQGLTIPVAADPALKLVYITGNIPARATTLENAGSQQIPSTGAAPVPESEAKGVARFRNLTSSKIQIPLGTVVQTLGASSIRFATTQEAEAAAGVGKTVDVPIEALGAGAGGNLEVDLIQAVEGPLGLSLSVTNPAPTSGGTSGQAAAPSPADRERLRRALMETLRAQARLEMLASLPPGSLIFPDTLKDMIVLEEVYDPPAGEMGASLSLTMRVKFAAQYASGNDLSELTTLSLAAALEDGFSAAPAEYSKSEPLTFRPVGIPVTDESGRTIFQLQVERRIRRAVDARRVLSLAQGRRVESALARLNEAFAFSSPPQIKMSPAWWPWLPLAPFRMDVVIR